MNNFLIFVTIFCMYFIEKLNAACTSQQINSISGYQRNPRPGIHYSVTWSTKFNKNKCPSGTTLAYIKTPDEWADWKFMRGTVPEIFFIQIFEGKFFKEA